MYTLFVDHVASGRHVSSTVVRNERWAYIYDSITAVRHGLIDHEGDLHTVLALIGQKMGIHPLHFTLLTRNQKNHGIIAQTLPRVLTYQPTSSRRIDLCHSYQALVLPYTTMTTLCHTNR
jgi:ClpP class serine protease